MQIIINPRKFKIMQKHITTPLQNGNTISLKRPVILSIRDSRTKQYVQTTIYLEPNDPRTDEQVIKEFKQGRKSQITDKRQFNKAAKLANFNKTSNWTTGPVYPNPGIEMQLEKPDLSLMQQIKSVLNK